MIKAPLAKGDYDNLYHRFIKDLSTKMKVLDDDFLVLYVGSTGTGKTSFALHGLELYLGEERSRKCGVDLIGLNKESFADSLKFASEMEHPRATLNDEANVSKRDSLSKYNKDLLDLYFSVRGLNILHQWCNPSLDMLDKSFIREKIRGVFFIPGKQPKYRRYYYFRRKDILRIMDKYKRLDLDILRRVKGTAYYCGWFKPYKGVMWKQYLKKKEDRMQEKVENFYERWGSKLKEFKNADLQKIFGLSSSVIRKHSVEQLQEGVHYRYNGGRQRVYNASAIDVLKNFLDNKVDRRLKQK